MLLSVFSRFLHWMPRSEPSNQPAAYREYPYAAQARQVLISYLSSLFNCAIGLEICFCLNLDKENWRKNLIKLLLMIALTNQHLVNLITVSCP